MSDEKAETRRRSLIPPFRQLHCAAPCGEIGAWDSCGRRFHGVQDRDDFDDRTPSLRQTTLLWKTWRLNRLLTSNLWAEIKKLTKGGSQGAGGTQACIAYLTAPDLLHWRPGDVLIVNASDGAIKCGETSAKALRALLKKGVSLYSEPRLHAKVVLVGDTAVVGSANVSASSQSRLLEAAILTTSPAVVNPVHAYVHQLATPNRAIDETFLRRIEALPVAPRRAPFGGGRRTALRRPRVTKEHKTWLVVLGSSGRTRDEAALATARTRATERRTDRRSEVDEFWWSGHRLDDAEPGDSVIRVWKNRQGGFAGESVSLAATILMKHRIGPRRYFFLEVPQRSSWVTWSAFKRALNEVGEKALGPYSGRVLAETTATSLVRIARRRLS